MICRRDLKKSPLTICHPASETSTEAYWLLFQALKLILNCFIFSLATSVSVPLLSFQGCSLLQRSKSFCQAEIEKLLDSEAGSNELIGDFTKVRENENSSVCLLVSCLKKWNNESSFVF